MRAAVYDWCGFYAGVQTGYGFGRVDWTTQPGLAGSGYTTDGWLAGGQIGASVQSGIFVAGVEADWIWTGIRGHGFGDTGVFENFNRTDVNWLATVTGRVGVVPWTRALLYGKAGAAAAEVHNQNRQAVPAFASAEVSGTSVVPGYVFGVGLEHMLAGNWSARLEYDYVTLFNGGQVQEGALNFFGSPASAAATNQIKQSPQMVKLGINYRFAPPPP